MSDPLPADLSQAVARASARLGPFADVRFFSDVTSTNDLALSLAAGGAGQGTSVLADSQRAGRGRHGHTWFSPSGAGLYLSTIARPSSDAPPSCISLLTLAAGVAAAQAVTAVTALPVELKWPNDLVIGRPWRKIGGILCESTMAGGRLDAVVIGIGINVRAAAYPPELASRATSLEIESGRALDRPALTVELLAGLRLRVAELAAGNPVAIVNAWRRFGRAGLNRAGVRWMDAGAERRGLACAIDDDGALVVEQGGRPERLIAGEVIWDRLPDGSG